MGAANQVVMDLLGASAGGSLMHDLAALKEGLKAMVGPQEMVGLPRSSAHLMSYCVVLGMLSLRAIISMGVRSPSPVVPLATTPHNPMALLLIRQILM